jgi:predicted metal-dependent hydrolase
MAPTSTPTDLKITSRPLQIDHVALTTRWWHGGDPVATAFFNALSAAFPQGETFFIESVRRYRNQTDPVLNEQISAFIQQEAMHTREHLAFNRLIKDAGYNTEHMEAQVRRRLGMARERPEIVQLAITVGLEHFTAIMARMLLDDPDPLPGTPREILRLWQWHAIEELEHKSVAYDTWLAVTTKLSAWRRWSIRTRVMVLISLQFWYSNFERMADFFRQDGINTTRTWWRVFKFLCFKPGIARKIFLPYMSFFRPSFHPWQHDERALIQSVEQTLAAEARS